MLRTSRLSRACLASALLSASLLWVSRPAQANDDYQLGPDSQIKDVPHGEVTRYQAVSKVFPSAEHNYWVYIPKQYDPNQPACVMVFLDGGGFQSVNGQFRTPVVFDNLIAAKQMPVTIAIMIDPGIVPATAPNALPRYNRSHEYDAPTDQYARFLLEEILPEVGKKYNLTHDPNGRALCGASSGGICAFTAAWERPDQFRRVISFIGSFTNLQGGHSYPGLIRKYEPRPIRVYMQDGSNDQDIYSGSWFLGNQDVAAALRFARYDSQFIIGDGGHSGRQGGAILPDALRWLWRDYPAPIKPAESTPQPVMQIVAPGEDWRLASEPGQTVVGLATNAAGEVYFTDAAHNRICKVGADGKVVVFKEAAGGATGLTFGPNGKLYAAQSKNRQVVAYDAQGRETVLAKGVSAEHLVANHEGAVYLTEPQAGRVWLVDKKGKKSVVDTGLPGANGLILTPDQSLLLVSHTQPGKFVYSFHLLPDGALADKQAYFDVHIHYGESVSGAGGMTTDTQGNLYIASAAGVQVCDQAGRVIGILNNPERTPTANVVFGGPNLDTLYAIADGKLYRRKTRATGVLPFQEPIKPPGPRL